MRALSTVTILLAASFAGCFSPADSDTHVDVLASFYPLAYVTSRIAGDAVSVGTLVPNGIEPHDWDASSRDILRLGGSTLLIVQGDGFEPWLAGITSTLGDAAPHVIDVNKEHARTPRPLPVEIAGRGVEVACARDASNESDDALLPDARCRTVAMSGNASTGLALTIDRASTYAVGTVTKGLTFTVVDEHGRTLDASAEVRAVNGSSLTRIYALEAREYSLILEGPRDPRAQVVVFPAPSDARTPESADPHTWLDPVAFASQTRVIKDALATRYPEHAATFESNLEALLVDLDAVDQAYARGLALCETRVIVTSHDAFAHLAARYGFDVLAIAGLSPEAEPDARTVARVAEAARAHDVRIVFFEDLVDPRVADVLADEIGAETRLLSPIEGLSPSAQARGADYVSVMGENLANLREAMRCA